MKWNEEQKDIIRKYYPIYGGTGPKGCIERLKKIGVERTKKAVSLMAFRLKITYDGEQKGCFRKGNIAHNKGKKMSDETYAKCSKTFFKKGHIPHNTKFDGALSYRRDDDNYYWYVRINKKKWTLLSRVIYQNVHNVVLTRNEIVKFRDGDSNNIHPDNLYLVTMKENMLENNPKLHYPPEVVAAIKLNNKIKKTIKSYAKKQNKRLK